MKHPNDALTETRYEFAGALNIGAVAARKIFTLPETVIATLALWQDRWMARQKLRGIDDRQLDDVGLSREQIEGQAAIPFWKA